jgi:hypothetical protein
MLNAFLWTLTLSLCVHATSRNSAFAQSESGRHGPGWKRRPSQSHVKRFRASDSDNDYIGPFVETQETGYGAGASFGFNVKASQSSIADECASLSVVHDNGKAERGAWRITEIMEGSAEVPREGTKVRKSYVQRRDRERRTIKAWFKRHARDLPVLGRKSTFADVEDFVRKKLRKYVRCTRGRNVHE